MSIAKSLPLQQRPAKQRTDGSDAPRRRPRPWRSPYALAAGCFLLFMLSDCVRLPWCGDIGQHAATLWRLRENLAHPRSPLIDVAGDGSPYFSPYTVLGALLCRLTGWSPLQALHVLAFGNVLLLTAGIWAFVRALTDRVWAPVLALACYVWLWGTDLRIWSGVESLVSLCFGVSFPSAFAAGLSLLGMAWALRLLGRVPGRTGPRQPVRRLAEHLGLGLLAVVVVLSHLFTGVSLLLGVLAILAGSRERFRAPDWAYWSATAAVGLVVVLAWPYWSILDLQQDSSLDSMHKALYTNLLSWVGLSLVVGVPALAARFRRDRRDPLFLLFVLSGAAVTYGWVSGHYSWSRLIPSAMLALQLATAVEVARLPWRQWRRSSYVWGVVLALVAGVWIQADAVLLAVSGRAVPKAVLADMRTIEPWKGYMWTAPYLHYGDVVMTADSPALQMLGAYGYYTVRPGYPDPAIPVPARALRFADTAAFFDASTGEARRRELLERYHAHWILTTPAHGPLPSGPDYHVVAVSRQGEYLIRFEPRV